MRFDDSQRQCIEDQRLPYYCLAGAGSGKTSTLLGKAAEWSYQARGRRICIVCFNKGIQTEISHKIKRQGLIGVEARTLHSLGLSFIRDAFREGRSAVPPKDNRPFYFGQYRDEQQREQYRRYGGLQQVFLDYFGVPGWPEVLRRGHEQVATITFVLKALLGAGGKKVDFDPTKHAGWPQLLDALVKVLAPLGCVEAQPSHAHQLAVELVERTMTNRAVPKVPGFLRRRLYVDHFVDYAHACFMESTYGGDLFGRYADRELDGYVPKVPGFVALALGLTPIDLDEIDYRSFSQLLLPTALGHEVRDALVYRMQEFQELDFQSQITVGAYAATLAPSQFWGFLVDESQDLDLYQWYLTSQAFPRLIPQQTPRIWYVGDEKQCQPGTTQVRLGDGREVDLADLEVGAKIATHSRRTSMFTTSTVLAKAARPYRGPMYEVTAGGRTTRCTPEHLWNVKYLDRKAHQGVYVTYLMQRGDWFRLGWCRLFTRLGILHLSQRTRLEKADRAWILQTHQTKREASLYESYLAAEYGICLAMFEPVPNNRLYDAEGLTWIFNRLTYQREKAERLLSSHGRLIEFPMYDCAKHGGRKRTTISTVETCNLLPGIMAIPLFTDLNKNRAYIPWEPITLKTEPFDGLVYSIEVDKTQTYVADGLATHNCIYRWRGASARRFIAQTASHPHGSLLYSYRCPEVVVEKANALSGQIKGVVARDVPFISRAADQPGYYMALPEMVDPFDFERFAAQHRVPMADTVVLARTNADLMTWQLWAIVRQVEIAELLLTGLPVEPEKLRELIALSLLSGQPGPAANQAAAIIVERRGRPYLEEFLDTLGQVDQGQYAKVVFGFWRAEPGLDLDELPDEEVRAGIGAVTTILDWCGQDKGRIVSDFRRIAAGPLRIAKGPGLTLSTIHRYKGREKPFVFIVSKVWAKLWGQAQKNPDARDEELCLMYVAVTRACRAVFCCGADLPGPLVECRPTSIKIDPVPMLHVERYEMLELN